MESDSFSTANWISSDNGGPRKLNVVLNEIKSSRSSLQLKFILFSFILVTEVYSYG